MYEDYDKYAYFYNISTLYRIVAPVWRESASRTQKKVPDFFRQIVAETSLTLHEMASISASVSAPGTMVNGIRSWLPSLPANAVTNGPGPSLPDAPPSTRTEIERSSVSILISSSRLLPSRM